MHLLLIIRTNTWIKTLFLTYLPPHCFLSAIVLWSTLLTTDNARTLTSFSWLNCEHAAKIFCLGILGQGVNRSLESNQDWTDSRILWSATESRHEPSSPDLTPKLGHRHANHRVVNVCVFRHQLQWVAAWALHTGRCTFQFVHNRQCSVVNRLWVAVHR
jgi:hypothetical protein